MLFTLCSFGNAGWRTESLRSNENVSFKKIVVNQSAYILQASHCKKTQDHGIKLSIQPYGHVSLIITSLEKNNLRRTAITITLQMAEQLHKSEKKNKTKHYEHVIFWLAHRQHLFAVWILESRL